MTSQATTSTTKRTPATRKAAAKPAVEQAAEVAGTPVAEVTFIFERETKGAVRYAEVPAKDAPADAEPVIGTLYLRKAHLNGKVPSAVRLTITDLTAGA